MSKIRSKNTRFEENFIALLINEYQGRFITHARTLKGTPDIVFEKERICIFLDSDFWHGWQFPRWKHLLKDDFWRNKIINNRKRDVKNMRLLKKDGWKVIRVWEHSIIKDPEHELQRIIKLIS